MTRTHGTRTFVAAFLATVAALATPPTSSAAAAEKLCRVGPAQPLDHTGSYNF